MLVNSKFFFLIGLPKITEFMCVGVKGRVFSKSGKEIKKVEDFQYLGAWINITKKEIGNQNWKSMHVEWRRFVKLKTGIARLSK